MSPRPKPIKFKKLANITAKNKAAALLTGTGKRRRKPFKGLSYSFINKKKKRVKKELTEDEEREISSVNLHVRELNLPEAMKVEREIAAEIKLEEVSEGRVEEIAEDPDDRLATHSGAAGRKKSPPTAITAVGMLEDSAESEVGTEIGEATGGSPEDEAMTLQDDERGLESPDGTGDGGSTPRDPLELALSSEEEEQEGSSDSSEQQRILKGKARKSIPQVTLKKAFVPCLTGAISPPEDSLSDEYEDEDGKWDSSVGWKLIL